MKSMWFVVCLAASCVAEAQVVGLWTPLPPMLQARQEVGAAVIANRLYVSGGLHSNVPPLNLASMEAFDFTLQTWSNTAPMPSALDHHMQVALDGMIYVLGGYVRVGNVASAVDTVFVYDPILDDWSNAAPMPAARGAAWAVSLGRKIYVVGGAIGSTSFNTLFIYDVDTGLWDTGAPMSTARNHLNVVTDGLNLYAIGGRHGSSFTANERYIVAEDRWESLAPMPTARAAMACAYIDGKIYCAGGETPQLFNILEVYDIASDSWQPDTPMRTPRHGVAAVVYEGAMVVAAGGIVQGYGPTNAVDMFTPASNDLPLAGKLGLTLIFASLLLLALHRMRRLSSSVSTTH